MTGLLTTLVPPPVGLALKAAPYAALVGVSLLAWHFDSRAVANAEAVRVQAQQFKDAQAAAAVIAQQALAHEQAVYQQKATEADSAYQTQLAAAQSAADRYIASHSVQPATAQGGASTAVASAQGGSPAVPANVPTSAVMVSADDVRVCTSAADYALKAHDWAKSISR